MSMFAPKAVRKRAYDDLSNRQESSPVTSLRDMIKNTDPPFEEEDSRPQVAAVVDRQRNEGTTPVIDMQKLAEKTGLDVIDEIKTLYRSLTFGEMMEVAKKFGDILRQNNNPAPEDFAIAMTFHKWSKSEDEPPPPHDVEPAEASN